MKKIVVAIAILLANGAFVSCTELDDNSDNLEILSTGGEEEQDPDDDDDDETPGGQV